MFQTWFYRVAAASSLAVFAFSCATAAEPTAAEQQYEQLKEAEKHADKLLAERWHKLVRQRQWVDKTGKHKTYARYVDHDPNGQWVKLLVLVKKGEEQTYKEGTIPLARLSKTDQALVKRIGIVRKQVETALADAPAGDAPRGEGSTGESREGEPFGEMSEGREGLSGEQPAADGAAGFGRESFAPSADPTAIGAPPGGLPFSLPSMSATPAVEPWRTDFAAFAGNFSPSRGEEGPGTLSWGELHALKAVHDKERMLAMLKSIPAEQQPPKAIRYQQGFAYGWARSGLGEVMWTASLDGSDATAVAATGLKHDLQLPAPYTLALVPDPEYAGDASRFVAGQPVQFIGRFAELGGFGDPPQLKLFVRLPTDQRGSKPTSASEPATRPASDPIAAEPAEAAEAVRVPANPFGPRP